MHIHAFHIAMNVCTWTCTVYIYIYCMRACACAYTFVHTHTTYVDINVIYTKALEFQDVSKCEVRHPTMMGHSCKLSKLEGRKGNRVLWYMST